MKKSQKLLNLTLISGLLISPLQVFAYEKSEMVYSNLDYDGTRYKTVVSNHLSFVSDGETEDETELKNILNINGSETFEQKEQKLSWKSMGDDIFYQGDTEKELPIQTEIKYFLNDEEKTVDEMLGKEGKVTIKLHFKNKIENQVKVNGRTTTLYTPFVTTIGTMLDSDHNKNITITNGKIVSTGSRSMIIGLASPGLYDSIGLKDLESLDEITLEYTTTKFELNNIYIVSTPKLLEETDFQIFDKMDELYSNMNELQKNMNILEQGVKELENGSNTLANGSKELMNSLKTASDAIDQIKNGAVSLDNGLKQIITSLESAEKELNSTNLQASLKDLNTLKTQNTNTINTMIKKSGMSESELASAYQQYNLANYTGTDETMIGLKSTYELILLLKANNTAIDTTITTLYSLTTKLTTLVTTLKTALTQAESGASTLSAGLTEVKSGINKIYNGSKDLNTGVQTLNTGIKTLSDGTTTFNEQGIKKLTTYANTLKSYSNKAEALIKLSEDYKGFTSNNSNTTNFVSMVKSAKITYKK